MSEPTDGPLPYPRVRALFERALELPATEREVFVQQEAGADQALAEEVRDLLRAGDDGRTTNLRAAGQAGLAQTGDASAAEPLPDGVQATATDELLRRLTEAPKLDTNRFELHGEIGRGGQGAVLKIHDRHLNRRLAMKVQLECEVHDGGDRQRTRLLLARFLEEAQVTSQLDHPGVVPVHELGLDQNGKVYFTMRLVKGKTAGEIFRLARAEEDGWTPTRALEVVLKVCDTMAFAHEKGVLHRDLKPGNVMVGRFGEVYVMDWGLAKVLGQADRHDLRIRKDESAGGSKVDSARKRDAEGDTGSSVVSMDGQQWGTPSYMAPEQARSEALDARADVYAIGAMMYELLTGRAPYVTPGVRKLAYRILDDVVDGPPKRIDEIQKGVPAELVAIVERAMAREREQRYATVTALAAEVRAFLDQRVVKAYRTGALVEMKLWMRRNRALAASLTLAALFLVAGIAVTTVFWNSEAKAKDQFAAKVRQFDQLALVVNYDRLMTVEPTLVPGWPDQLPAIDAWVHDAERLKRGAEIASAHAYFSMLEPAESDSRAANSFLSKTLRDLDSKIPNLDAALARMSPRQKWAQAVGALTLSHPNAKHTWAEARAAIARADGVVASTLYAGQDIALRDQDVWGLVPIGMNSESKLWEFYDLRSAWDGKQDPATLSIPTYDANGRLEITGATGIVLVLLPGGTLPDKYPDKDDQQDRRLELRLDPFFLGKYEVTQGQWQRLGGKNRSKDRISLALPVQGVSWFEGEQTLRDEGMVLPSELRWEYSIRAGTTTKWWTGDTEEKVKSMENIGTNRLLPVGSQNANAFGLFDMGGNLCEWCLDVFDSYGTERAGDGVRIGQVDGDSPRVRRGGSAQNLLPAMTARYSTSSARIPELPTERSHWLGLRAARTLLP